jgi:hypothetical protein
MKTVRVPSIPLWILWCLLILCALASAGLSPFIQTAIDESKYFGAGALILVLAAAICGFFFVTTAISRGKSESVNRYSATVFRIEGMLAATYRLASFTESSEVRITLYVPHKRKKDYLTQITHYYPTETPGSIPCLHISKGIVGRCYRTRQSQMLIVKKRSDYRQELIKIWSFTEEEAKEINPDRLAFLALPVIRKNGGVGAIIFLDAKSRRTFTPGRIKLLEKIRLEIAKWA